MQGCNPGLKKIFLKEIQIKNNSLRDGTVPSHLPFLQQKKPFFSDLVCPEGKGIVRSMFPPALILFIIPLMQIQINRTTLWFVWHFLSFFCFVVNKTTTIRPLQMYHPDKHQSLDGRHGKAWHLWTLLAASSRAGGGFGRKGGVEWALSQTSVCSLLLELPAQKSPQPQPAGATGCKNASCRSHLTDTILKALKTTI